jgi:transcriptional regulator with GAF, ATPase, and Fis domain
MGRTPPPRPALPALALAIGAGEPLPALLLRLREALGVERLGLLEDGALWLAGEPTARPVPEGEVERTLLAGLRNLRRGAAGPVELLVASRRAVPTDDLDALAALLGVSLARQRAAEATAEQRRRSEVLESLLPTLALALDVREVFQQISRVAAQVLPHDLLGMGLLSEDRRRLRIYATSDEKLINPPEFELPEAMQATMEWDTFIVHDLRIDAERMMASGRLYPPPADPALQGHLEMPLDQFRVALLGSRGIRSQLRVPIRTEGRVVGGLLFNSRSPDLYREGDAQVARRIADHLAMALSHQHLAEEQQRAAEARERARALESRVERLSAELRASTSPQVLGESRPWRAVLADAARVAPTEATVLLTGESGTGKEVVARLIHRSSPRRDGPFAALNCAALPEHLLESELFGHEKGAFTGALGARPGRIEQAAGGVLFLDEVGETSPAVQAKLLRVLQEREYQRLGSTRTLRADVRVVAATNRDLRAAMARGEFREDLYYRLHVFELRLPPLRERRDDVLPLADAFLRELGQAVGRPAAGISKDARERLLAHDWPGNVRELRNAIERAVILCEGGLVSSEHLPISIGRPEEAPAASLPAGGLDLEALERDLVTQALAQARHNKTRAAKLLGLTRAQLYTRLERYDLRDPSAPGGRDGPAPDASARRGKARPAR